MLEKLCKSAVDFFFFLTRNSTQIKEKDTLIRGLTAETHIPLPDDCGVDMIECDSDGD